MKEELNKCRDVPYSWIGKQHSEDVSCPSNDLWV